MKSNFICLPLFLFMLDVWRYQDAHWGGGLAQEKEIHFVCSETKQKYLTGKLSCNIKRGTLVAKLVKIQGDL